MILITETHANNIKCPGMINPKTNEFKFCIGSDCMGWNWIEGRLEREDHSSGKEMMHSEMLNRPGSTLTRKGPPGCDGVYILEARGYCSKYQN